MELGPASTVTLRAITADTVRLVCRLSEALTPQQRKMVADNAVSIAQAHFEPHAWFRAIYADETPVGFVMLHDDPEKDHVYLWRLMIAGPYQRAGLGRKAIGLILAHARSRANVREIRASYVPIEGGAGPFYRKLGFEPTGEIDDDEVVIRLAVR